MFFLLFHVVISSLVHWTSLLLIWHHVIFPHKTSWTSFTATTWLRRTHWIRAGRRMSLRTTIMSSLVQGLFIVVGEKRSSQRIKSWSVCFWRYVPQCLCICSNFQSSGVWIHFSDIISISFFNYVHLWARLRFQVKGFSLSLWCCFAPPTELKKRHSSTKLGSVSNNCTQMRASVTSKPIY